MGDTTMDMAIFTVLLADHAFKQPKSKKGKDKTQATRSYGTIAESSNGAAPPTPSELEAQATNKARGPVPDPTLADLWPGGLAVLPGVALGLLMIWWTIRNWGRPIDC